MISKEQWRAFGADKLPGLLGVEIMEVEPARVMARMSIRLQVLAPNGYLHAATIVALADTACGYGCVAGLPNGATGFTTIDLSSNFIGTAREGGIRCEATLVHGGRSTQVWDAQIFDENSDKLIALFRCTQMILYPRSKQE